MIKKIILTTVIFQCLTGLAIADNNALFSSMGERQHIFVNNRILAKVNGQAISVVDVMKKMDMLFYRQFPQYASSVEARYQFYQFNWKHVLNELIEKELIMADAEENKLEISNGDIRQEVETFFGPNIIANLDKAGLTYDEASTMVKEDLTIKRMLGSRVHAKAVRSVTPSDVRAAYEEYAKTNYRQNTWQYQVISIRGEDQTFCAETANIAHRLLVEEGLPIEQLKRELQSQSFINDKTSFNVSEEFSLSEKEVSDAHKEVLSTLDTDSFSNPIAQQSRAAKNATVFRIFYLKEMVPGGKPPFQEVENKLKNSLVDKEVEKQSEEYTDKLRKHYDIQKTNQNLTFPDNFQPFSLK